MGRIVLGVSLTLAACSTPGPPHRLVRGPDAALASDPRQTGDVRVIVQRPIRDRVSDGPPSVDQRTLVAVLQPDRAVWLAAARLDTTSALSLLAAMEASLQDAPPAASSDIMLEVAETLPPIDAPGQRSIDGGGWRWIGKTGTGAEMRCHMSLDDARGRTLARLTMDVATGADLLRALDGAARMSPERLTGAGTMEGL